MAAAVDLPMSGTATRSLRRAATAVAGLAALVVAGAAVGLIPLADDDLALATVRAGLVAVWALVGMALAAKRPDEPLAAVVLAAAVVGGTAVVASALVASGDGGTGAQAARALAVALLPAVAMHLVVVLPDGRWGRPTHRLVAAGAYGVALVVAAALVAARPELPPALLVTEAVAATVIAVVLANRRYVRARGEARQRMQWFGLAVTLAVEVVLVTLALRIFLGWPRSLAEIATAASVLVPLSLLPSLAPRLLGHVDRALGRAVSLTGLTAVVVGVYIVIVLGLGRSPTDDERAVLLLSMLAAAAAAVLYGPMRDRLTRVSNQLVYGERHAPDEVLRTFGTRLTRAIPFDELLLQLAESLRGGLALRAAEVWTGASGRLDRVVSVPERSPAHLDLSTEETGVVARARVAGHAWLEVWLPRLLVGREDAIVRSASVTHGGELLGLLVVERPAGGDRFGEADDDVLAELARQVGLALHNLQLDSALQESLRELERRAEELRASRARVVAAADAERRKIERNLHDGAQQHLVALAVTVRLAREVAATDPAHAVELLEQLGHDLQDAVQELRDLAHGIYPPVLMDRGLVAALESAAARSTLPVAVVAARDVGRFPQDVEAAVYFCCLEALQNAAKHAGEDATVTVTLERRTDGDGADHLAFAVVDDGPGFDAHGIAGRGHGFVNMSDRLGAIGGTVQVDSTPAAGTCVSGVVPLDDGR